MTPHPFARVIVTATLFVLVASASLAQTARPLEFNRDVRPILSDACFQCHGPDKQKRKAKLHFDTEEGARESLVAGKPDESELIKRITHSDKAKRMPPPSAAITLTAKQIDTLKAWIKQGAKWQKHWSLIPPARSPLPGVKNKAWPKNALDYFVLARLEAEGLAPSPEADPVTLIRRLSLDLTGLPATPTEVDAFTKAWHAAGAKRETVYGALVERLLASPRYGERMALPWLNAARYADTNGYQNDGPRTMWRWRDWVIDAFNNNMAFDRFTVEQLAGDLLPKPTLEQRIATGFNRNHRGNSEGGVIPEEYAVEYVVDRVDTTATVWLGLSAGCARCHDHKYDPISQKEFYQLYAYFNNIPERGKTIKYGNSPPYIKSPTPDQAKKLAELTRVAREKETAFRKLAGEVRQAQAAWEKKVAPLVQIDWAYQRGLQQHLPLMDGLNQLSNVIHSGPLRHHSNRVPRYFDGERVFDAGNVGDFGFFDKFSIGVWIRALGKKGGTILSRMVDADRADGYSLVLEDGKLHVNLIKRWLDDAIRVETAQALKLDQWNHILFSYDGTRVAAGIKVYVNGQPARLKVNLDDLNQSFRTKEPFRIGGGGGKDKRFVGSIAELRVYDHVLDAQDVAALGNANPLERIVRIPAAKRTPAQAHKVYSYFLDQKAPATIRKAFAEMLASRDEMVRFDESLPTTMVMQEMPTPRPAFILLRGEYDKKGKQVGRAVPAAFPPVPNGEPNNRLGLAKWLISKENPLTARVAVNRYWQLLFGAGIVRTVEDFGAQGDWPSHPELLDWLAVEFMEPFSRPPLAGEKVAVAKGERVNSWDVKRLLKLIVTSATYRQASRVTPALVQRDPDNRLLARGPRIRLSADMIRDQALFASGLLIERLGGESVRPYQPKGLVRELTGTEEYEQDHGEKLYRRSLYTHWRRTIPPPAMMNLDAANRETCVVRETRTNTPLQALNLMNDVTFVEAARVLA
ncbi:MAG: DUF1553 domain-containing protein [Planctomycetes bacterium]|nr:DUF1553 domain-containing protein [Planctomycetota bacterium]